MGMGKSKAITPFKALLFLAAGSTAVAAAAYKFDVVDRLAAPLATATSSLELTPDADPGSATLQGPKLAALTPPANDLATPPATLSPSFDVVRVESDGSVVVAGRPRQKPALRSSTAHSSLAAQYLDPAAISPSSSMTR